MAWRWGVSEKRAAGVVWMGGAGEEGGGQGVVAGGDGVDLFAGELFEVEVLVKSCFY